MSIEGHWLVRFCQWAEGLGLVWRVSAPGVMATGTNAEAMVRKPPKGQWIFGYGPDGETACAECRAAYEKHEGFERGG